MAFSPGGDFFLAGARREFAVCKWDLRTGKRLPCFKNHANRQVRVRRTCVVPGGRLILTVCEYHEWSKDKAKDNREIARKSFVLAGITGATVAFSVMKGPGSVRFALQAWDVANETPVLTVDCGMVEPRLMAASPDGHRALVVFNNKVISLLGL